MMMMMAFEVRVLFFFPFLEMCDERFMFCFQCESLLA